MVDEGICSVVVVEIVPIVMVDLAAEQVKTAVDLVEMNRAVVEKDDCCVVIGVGGDGCGGWCTHRRRIVISWIVDSWKWWLAGCCIIIFCTSFCFV